jgi:hypothetical protein
MSDAITMGVLAGERDGTGAVSPRRRLAPDLRRRLQLALAGLWLLDGLLQCQPSMFTRAFPDMLAGAARGNPAFVAGPIMWSARLIDHHVVVMNAGFAAMQLMLGLGIAWRPTLKLALAASIAWAAGVWWLGEGLGSVLTGTASPVSGAPGAVILYALLAVLLWPAVDDREAPYVAARAIGVPAARVLWLILWASMAWMAMQPAARASQAASGMISAAGAGQPRWLALTDGQIASLLSHHGLQTSIALVVTFVFAAAAVDLPTGWARAAIIVILVAAAVIWVGQGFGGIFTGAGTDPNSGPLLALLAAAYWPGGRRGRAVPGAGAARSAQLAVAS